MAIQTRVIQSIGDPGKWQAQYFDASMSTWFDIGDAQTDMADADSRAAMYELTADPRVSAWADSFDVWHVRVPRDVASPLIAARRRFQEEITARDAHAHRDVWMHPERVESLDTAETIVYREGTPGAPWPATANESTKSIDIVIATTETGHFSWMGVGATDTEAREALLRAWDAHCAEYGSDPRLLREVDDFNYSRGTLGQGFRDREPLGLATSGDEQ